MADLAWRQSLVTPGRLLAEHDRLRFFIDPERDGYTLTVVTLIVSLGVGIENETVAEDYHATVELAQATAEAFADKPARLYRNWDRRLAHAVSIAYCQEA